MVRLHLWRSRSPGRERDYELCNGALADCWFECVERERKDLWEGAWSEVKATIVEQTKAHFAALDRIPKKEMVGSP